MPSKLTRFIFAFIAIYLATTFAAAAKPDPHRFEPLLKTSWYGVYMSPGSGGQGGKIGYMSMALEKVAEPVDGWRMAYTMIMAVAAGGDSMGMTIEDSRIYRSPGGELYSSAFKIPNPLGNMTVTGRVANDSFLVTTDIAGQIIRKTLPYPLDYLDSVLCVEMHVISGSLNIGDSIGSSYFEPSPPLTGLIHQSARIVSQEEYLFNGVPTEVFVADITILEMGVTSRSKIDRFGNTLEGTVGGAMKIKLEEEVLAKRLDSSFDIIADNLVVPKGTIGDPGSLETVVLRISGIDTSQVLATEMQTVRDDAGALVLEIRKPQAPDGTSGDFKLPSGMEENLKSEALIQSDDPKIKKLAAEIVGEEKDRWQTAIKINDWVYRNIEKRFTPDFSNASQTLNSKSGDCGEHTALTVALLRAAGIPARPVAGLVYSPQFEGFGYHAWTDVYMGRWIQMDPTWGETLANPTHIALARGGILAQISILTQVMGRINIEVLKAD